MFVRSIVSRPARPAFGLRRSLWTCLAAAAAVLAGAVCSPARAASPYPAIAANDNRLPAGHGAQAITLVARMGAWYPDGPGTVGVPIAAFGEAGQPLQVPGPLLRVPAGKTVALRLRSELQTTIRVYGLRVGSDGDHPITLRPGASLSFPFRRTVPGTYGYWTTDEQNSKRSRWDLDSQLHGAIVIDDPRKPQPNDRVLVLGEWLRVFRKNGHPNFGSDVLTINGRAWPATERLTYVQGTTVRWRVFNASMQPHPMHLHGFPFTLDAVGDGIHVASNAGKPAYREVTHRIAQRETFDAHWVADRVGAWMFHCHIVFHILPHEPLGPSIANRPPVAGFQEQLHRTHDAMGSMIVAVNVIPGPKSATLGRPTPTHRIALDVIETAKPEQQHFPLDHFAYIEHDGGKDITGPGTQGPLIVLNAGESASIAVNNHLRETTAVHWHGISVQHSVDDGGMVMNAGMPGMGGMSRDSAEIQPGKSFVAQFTPLVAGTYLYHTHMDDVWQLAGGLSGPLVVLPKGATYDAATDHIVMVTSVGDQFSGDAVSINGFLTPPPIVVHVGVPQRLRLINMTSVNADLVLSLDGADLATWTPIAKDGMDLAPALRAPRRATQALTIGETRDFRFIPTMPGRLMLNATEGGPVGAIAIDILP